MKKRKGLFVIGIVLLFISACFFLLERHPDILGEHLVLFKILGNLVLLPGLFLVIFAYSESINKNTSFRKPLEGLGIAAGLYILLNIVLLMIYNLFFS